MRADANEPTGFPAGLAQSLLQEIAHRLTLLASTGEPAAIDLRSLPMTSADRSDLETRLGRGDVEVALRAGGASEIWETHYPGVWWVRHFGSDDKLAAERIEITAIPEIVVAQSADIAAALARLTNDLARTPSGAIGEHAQHV